MASKKKVKAKNPELGFYFFFFLLPSPPIPPAKYSQDLQEL
jgi:hypothetical protein